MESVLIHQLTEAVTLPFLYLSNTGKRVHWFYLLTSLVIAYLVFRAQKQEGSFLRTTFNLQLWFGISARTDYALIFTNAIVKVFLIAPLLVGVVWLATAISSGLTTQFGPMQSPLSTTSSIVLYTITLVVISDFFSYLVHYLFHIIPFFWHFHKVHHSATSLTPFTQYRMHPVELLANNLRGILVKGCLTGLFMYWAGGNVSIITFFGVNVLNFLFLLTGANLRHSHIKFSYFPFLERLLISPYQHQIHHSNAPAHYNTNMGSRLAVWDALFGTLLRSKDVAHVEFGLDSDNQHYNTYWQNLASPFIDVLRSKNK